MQEMWDIYDSTRRRTGKLHERGKPLGVGEYHLVVQIWIINDEGKYLISQRHPSKSYPMYWEATGGAVIAGENSLHGAIREVQEELGLTLDSSMGQLMFHETHRNVFADIWLYRSNAKIEDLKLQSCEVVDAKWASAEEIEQMCKSRQFVDLSNTRKRIYQKSGYFLKKIKDSIKCSN